MDVLVNHKTIMDRWLDGEELNEEKFLDEIDVWHEADTSLELHEWLGLNKLEYASWMEKSSSLISILDFRQKINAWREFFSKNKNNG